MTAATPAGLISAYAFDAAGHPRKLDTLPSSTEQHNLLWLSFDGDDPGTTTWLTRESGIAPQLRVALLDGDSRPRVVRADGGMALVLNSAGRTIGPAGLTVLRIATEPGRVITIRDGDMTPPTAEGPDAINGAAGLLASFVTRVVNALEPVVDEIIDGLDALEEQLIQQPGRTMAAELGSYRRQLVQVHRYLAPQGEVLRRLVSDLPGWIDEVAAHALREAALTAAHQVDELQAARDHAAVIQEEFSARLTDRLNRRLYLFTVIASIFLPLTFFTGLLGANVDGIPFANESWAFAAVAALCVAIAAVQFAILRLMRLL